MTAKWSSQLLGEAVVVRRSSKREVVIRRLTTALLGRITRTSRSVMFWAVYPLLAKRLAVRFEKNHRLALNLFLAPALPKYRTTRSSRPHRVARHPSQQLSLSLQDDKNWGDPRRGDQACSRSPRMTIRRSMPWPSTTSTEPFNSHHDRMGNAAPSGRFCAATPS
jgi:hypothetical protein